MTVEVCLAEMEVTQELSTMKVPTDGTTNMSHLSSSSSDAWKSTFSELGDDWQKCWNPQSKSPASHAQLFYIRDERWMENRKLKF